MSSPVYSRSLSSSSLLGVHLIKEDLQHSLLSSTVADHALLDHQALLVVEVQLHLYLVGVEVRVRVQLYLAVVEVRVRLQA